MKFFFKKLSVLSVLTTAVIISAQAVPETYILDNTHTSVTFHVNHFGFSNPSGKWMANGTLILDEENPENSKVNATINVADVVTGVHDLDKHLTSKDFFNIKTYPTATFVSNKVEVVKDSNGKPTGNAKVSGILTLEGVSKPIVLDVTLNKIGMFALKNKKTVGLSATTTLKRSDFGMDSYIPNVGDAVTINIEAEANKKD